MKRSKKAAGKKERLAANDALLKMRFEAAIFPGRTDAPDNWANDLDVDRVPDAEGRVRALITVADLVRLLDRGLEVRLFRAYPFEPLDPSLIMTDEAFKGWLNKKISNIKANPGPKPFIEPDK